jgi:hypothetical protein
MRRSFGWRAALDHHYVIFHQAGVDHGVALHLQQQGLGGIADEMLVDGEPAERDFGQWVRRASPDGIHNLTFEEPLARRQAAGGA